jgi:hypothetical protein
MGVPFSSHSVSNSPSTKYHPNRVEPGSPLCAGRLRPNEDTRRPARTTAAAPVWSQDVALMLQAPKFTTGAGKTGLCSAFDAYSARLDCEQLRFLRRFQLAFEGG